MAADSPRVSGPERETDDASGHDAFHDPVSPLTLLSEASHQVQPTRQGRGLPEAVNTRRRGSLGTVLEAGDHA